MYLFTWEIVMGMSEGRFKHGDIFQNGDVGDMTINEEDELIWCDTLEPVIMVCGDEIKWELLR